jgi:hypothetical protein
VIVSVVLDNKRKQDLAATQLHNMTEMIVLVKLEEYRTVSCMIAQVCSFLFQLVIAKVGVGAMWASLV